MRNLACAALATAAICLAACSPASLVNPGTAGAGVKVAIAGFDHDSTGYTVRFTMTNRDTAAVGYGACMGTVQVPDGGAWRSVTEWGECELWLGVLPPTGTVTLTIPTQTLTPGTEARVTLNWRFVYGPDSAYVATSDPVVVPDPQ